MTGKTNATAENSLCLTFFKHGIYYCEECEWRDLQTFSIVQCALGLSTILTNIVSLALIFNRVHLVSKTPIDREALAHSGPAFWASLCAAGVVGGIGQIAESATLAAGIGPSTIGDKISHVCAKVFISNTAVLEAGNAVKFLLGTWKLTLFQHRYPSWTFVLITWLFAIVISSFSSLAAYACDFCYMDWMKPAGFAFYILLYGAGAVIVGGMIVYGTAKIAKLCQQRGQGTVIYLSSRARTMFRVATARNWLHSAVSLITMCWFTAIFLNPVRLSRR